MRRLLVGVLVLLLAPMTASAAAPTFDAASSSCSTVAGVMTVAHTVGATADGLLVGVTTQGGVTVASVTWNGSATGVALIASRDDGSGNTSTELWRVIAPTTGTHNIVVTLSNLGITTGCAAGISLIGTHQTTPSTASATNGDTSGASASLTVTVASNTGELVVGIGGQTAPNTYTSTGTGQTERVDANDGAGHNITMATQTGAASTVHSYTASGNREWGTVVASIQPAAAAGNKAGPLVGDIPMKSLVGGGLAR
jgi:hypothetical protein